MSLLTIIQAACGELGLTQPTQVIGNTDQQTIQMLALANREGKEFAAMQGQWTGWPELRKQYIFNMVSAGSFSGVSTTINSNVLSGFASTTGISQGYGVSGGSILTGTTVLSVGANSVTLDTPATSTVSGQVFSFGQVSYPLPSDLQFFIPQTEWDRNFRWQMLGPLSPQEWQTIISGISPVGPRLRFRVMGNTFNIQPPPGASQNDVLAFEYISTFWCMPQGGASLSQTQWTADTDVYAWPEDCAVLGLKWRWLAAKGLNYAEERATYEQAVERQIARSGANRTLPTNASSGSGGVRLLGGQNVPDTGFGS